MSALHITIEPDEGLQKMFGSYTDDQCLGNIYERFDDIGDFSNTEKKRVSILKPDSSLHGWRLFYKERLLVPRRVVREVLEWTLLKVVWALCLHKN